MTGTTWSYPLMLHGDVEHECRITLSEEGILWELRPLDEDHEDGETSSCLQDVLSFRDFGPPEVPVYLKAPPEVMDKLCAAVDAADAAWRKPLHSVVTAFFAAARAGNIDKIQELLEAGVEINAQDRQRKTALWHAAEASTLSLSRWLLEKGADVNRRDRYGRTLLMDAASRDQEERVELYKQHGADLTLRDNNGKTAWLTGVESRASGSLLRLVRACAEEDWPRALHFAAWSSNIAWMEGENWFVEACKPEMNLREGRYHRTPLQNCLLGPFLSPQAARWLVENGADLTVVDEDDGATLLHRAAKENLPWMVAACVAAGVDVNARDRAGNSALAYALDKNERPRLLRAMLDAGASPLLVAPCELRGQPPSPMPLFEKARAAGLVWSHWMLWQPAEKRRQWSGLCCYARVEPADAAPAEDDDPPPGTIWLEFPAEWTSAPKADLEARLLRALALINEESGQTEAAFAAPVLLSQTEALLQPAGWPRRTLWAVFPDETVAQVERFRDERPREIVSDPAALDDMDLDAPRRDWQWQARDWDNRYDKFTLTLRRGTLTWKAYNTEVVQTLARFRVEGPPPGDSCRTMPREMLDELCALIGDSARTWELPCPPKERRERMEKWIASQPPPLPPIPPPSPPPHQSGKWCYARIDIEDHFHTSSGAGSDGEWSCWMEFPAEWCYCKRQHLEQWLTAALRRAYEEMNRKASADPEGGFYALHRCWCSVLTRAEAIKQPWAERGKVLYSTDERESPPLAVPDEERRRPLLSMGDPARPPQPVPISPPPLPGRR